MKTQPSETLDDRVVLEAMLFLKEGATVRSVAQEVGMSKSTIAYDLRNRLKEVGRPGLYDSVIAKLDFNRQDAPNRGAKAQHSKTEKKFKVKGVKYNG